MTSARILIVDDHAMVRMGLKELVEQERDLEVCALAASSSEALAAVDEESPDLVIVDLSLPDRNGLELIKQLSARESAPAMLVHSMHSERLFAHRALKAGAKGYVSKEADADEIILAIRRVLEGQIYLREEISQLLLQVAAGSDPARKGTGVEALSDRELEVLGLLGKALTTREIAERLNLSIKTIETHRESIKTKLGLRNNNELIRRATEWWLEQS